MAFNLTRPATRALQSRLAFAKVRITCEPPPIIGQIESMPSGGAEHVGVALAAREGGMLWPRSHSHAKIRNGR